MYITILLSMFELQYIKSGINNKYSNNPIQ